MTDAAKPSRGTGGSAILGGGVPEESAPRWNLDSIVGELRQARLEWRKRRGKNEHGSRT